jgi:hypothetical protein
MSNRITSTFEFLHDSLGDGMALLAPAMAPALSAIAVYAGLAEEFGHVAALIGAFAVEGLGFASVRLLLRVWAGAQRNLPLRVSTVAMSATYMAATYAILASTHSAGYTMSFPLLTLTGALAYGVNAELQRQDNAELTDIDINFEREKRKIDLQAYRRQMSVSVSKPVSAPVHSAPATSGGQPSTPATVDDLRAYMTDNPEASVRQAAAALGMSKSWVAAHRSKD